MGENREPLLLLKNFEEDEEYYEDDCPGCKIDRIKRYDSSVPIKFVFFISIITLSAGSLSLSPSSHFYIYIYIF